MKTKIIVLLLLLTPLVSLADDGIKRVAILETVDKLDKVAGVLCAEVCGKECCNARKKIICCVKTASGANQPTQKRIRNWARRMERWGEWRLLVRLWSALAV